MVVKNCLFLLLGIAAHLLYLASVFHIYFKSPILNGIKETPALSYHPSSRVVFIVADGLQAEKAFHHKYGKYTPYLRSVIQSKGVWGVSHTRVPTESRVGHVSIFAGTYEDVSAITNGWKDNPVDFDHVFNKASDAHCWGSPDIVGLFDRNTSSSIHTYSYDKNIIDFADKNPSKVDQWVFDKTKQYFHNKQKKRPFSTQVIYFMHLLGIDTNGHTNKPDSNAYLENIRMVDNGIQNITNLIKTYYNDDKTTFILTSDHGMTPWGAHGTGLQSETETPFIAWGAGINTPNIESGINDDLQSKVWGLEDIKRYDMKQVDIPALISYLLGTSIPVNSVGTLPIDILDTSDQLKAEALVVNMKQIIEQYYSHEEKIKKTSILFFKHFQGLQFKGKETLNVLNDMIADNQCKDVTSRSKIIIKQALAGIKYYHQYHTFFFSIIVNLGFVLWIVLLVIRIFEDHTKLAHTTLPNKPSKRLLVSFYILVLVFAFIYMFVFQSLLETLLVFYPVIITGQIYAKLPIIRRIIRTVTLNMKSNITEDFTSIVLILIFVELLVISFFNRGILSLISFSLSLLPWLLSINRNIHFNSMQKFFCAIWSLLCILLSIFPQLPVITREENYPLVLCAGFVMTTIAAIYSMFNKSRNGSVISVITFLLVVSIVVKIHSVQSVKHGTGLPLYNQVYSWSSIIILPTLALIVDFKSISRLFAISLSLYGIYILVSISYDAMFLLVLLLTMAFWLILETKVINSPNKTKNNETLNQLLTKDHIRIALMFTYFLFLSFFGTGNIASINSFDIATMYCFQTVFNPWIQGVVVFIKMLIPFTVVNIFFRTLQNMIKLPLHGCFLVILLLGDIMAMNFFFLVKDEGSWLDIGQSLSHFVITLVFICVLVPVHFLTYYISGQIELPNIKLHEF